MKLYQWLALALLGAFCVGGLLLNRHMDRRMKEDFNRQLESAQEGRRQAEAEFQQLQKRLLTPTTAPATQPLPLLGHHDTAKCRYCQLDRPEIKKLLAAMATVESGNDDSKIGDNGKAIGRYQIHPEYFFDANVKDYVYFDMKVDAFAKVVIVAYWQRYCPQALRDGDLETLARVHNGGPKGASVFATEPYWAKVKAQLGR